MEYIRQLGMELENMLTNGEVDRDVTEEVASIASKLQEGKARLEDYYRSSTSQKVLSILDEGNQRIKR